MNEQTRNTYRLALIYGSTREGRRCSAVADWAIRSALSEGGFEVDPIDPRELDLPAHHREHDDRTLQASGSADAAMVGMLERLHWWAEALQQARTARPYQHAA